MIAQRCIVLTIVAVLAAPAALAKGVTAKIIISGSELGEPIVITDPGILERFSIWSGPRSQWRERGGEWQTDYSRTFMDFQAGLVEDLPPGITGFDVEFHQADTPGSEPWDETYRVEYAMAPGRPGGFFYLPASSRHIIRHGVEGNWLHSTEEWEEAVRPLIEEGLAEID